MKTLIKTLLFAAMAATFFACEKTNVNTSAVDTLDLERYAGKWYEIGRYDVAFQKGLVGVTATYTLNGDGTIKVINEGYKKTLDGKYDVAEGKARRRTNDNSGRLEVAFFANFYGQYNVMELADDYSWALIAGEGDKYLWILSRTPAIDTTVLNKEILTKAAERGFDTSKILWTEQP